MKLRGRRAGSTEGLQRSLQLTQGLRAASPGAGRHSGDALASRADDVWVRIKPDLNSLSKPTDFITSDKTDMRNAEAARAATHHLSASPHRPAGGLRPGEERCQTAAVPFPG